MRACLVTEEQWCHQRCLFGGDEDRVEYNDEDRDGYNDEVEHDGYKDEHEHEHDGYCSIVKYRVACLCRSHRVDSCRSSGKHHKKRKLTLNTIVDEFHRIPKE